MYYIGFDIGGTKCVSILAKSNGEKIEFLDRAEFATGGTWQEVVDQLCTGSLKQLKAVGLTTKDIAACGISCGGPLDSKAGIIYSPPNLPGWDEVPITEYVSQKLKIPSKLNNDADACAVAEWKYGAGCGTQNMIFLTFGTGLGAGLILNGKLYSGTNNMAGEVGHIRLEKKGPIGYNKAGSFEGFCSGGGIAQIGRAKANELLKAGKTVSFCPDGNPNNITAKAIAAAADAGDAAALGLLYGVGARFGRGLAVLIDILNPEVIVAGSIFVRAGKHLGKAMYAELKKEALPRSLPVCRIVPARLGDKIGDYGAIVMAMQ